MMRQWLPGGDLMWWHAWNIGDGMKLLNAVTPFLMQWGIGQGSPCFACDLNVKYEEPEISHPIFKLHASMTPAKRG